MKKAKAEEWGTSFLLTENYKTYTQACFGMSLEPVREALKASKTSLEVGENGNLHSHIFLSLKRSMRLDSLLKKYPKADIKKITTGTEQNVIEYVGNEKKETAKNCHIIAVYSNGDLAVKRGTRTDLTASETVLWSIKDAIDTGSSLRQVWQEFFPHMVRYGGGIKAYYDIIRQETSQSYAVKTIEQAEADIREAEATLLKRIIDDAQSVTDMSKPKCICGKECEWIPIERKYSEMCIECTPL